MKYPSPTVTFAIENSWGETTFQQTFKDSEEALSYLSGYLGAANGTLKDFHVDFAWDTVTLEV